MIRYGAKRVGPRILIVAALSGLLLLAASILLTRRGPREDAGGPTGGRLPGFRECAAEAGLDFKMAFLPGEQGENFKINLYDHGCGVAVADYDGDGRDGIYFGNQLP